MPINNQRPSDSNNHLLSVVPYLSPFQHRLVCLLVPWKQDLGWGFTYEEMRRDYMCKRPTTLFSDSPLHQQWILHILNTRHTGLEESPDWEHMLASALSLSLCTYDIPRSYLPHLTNNPQSTYIFGKLSTSGLHNRPRVPNATHAVVIDVRCAHPEQSYFLAIALKFITRGLPASMGIEIRPFVAGLTYVYQRDGATCVVYCTSAFDQVYEKAVEKCVGGSLNAYMSTGLHYSPSPYAVMEFPINRLTEDEITTIHDRAIDLAIW